MKVSVEPVSDRTRPEGPVNFAVNNGGEYFPHISASSSHPEHTPYYANDGNYWYHKTPANRWITAGSSNKEEWITLNFGRKRPVEKLRLYFLDDGENLFAPDDYKIQVWEKNAWKTISDIKRVPDNPAGHKANKVNFSEPQNTEKIRVVMEKSTGDVVGLTEIEAWGNTNLPLGTPVAEIPNLAYNQNDAEYPSITASHTYKSHSLNTVNDMKGLIPKMQKIILKLISVPGKKSNQ